eukprot:5280935-Pyramimonas_sp.AAC.1
MNLIVANAASLEFDRKSHEASGKVSARAARPGFYAGGVGEGSAPRDARDVCRKCALVPGRGLRGCRRSECRHWTWH